MAVTVRLDYLEHILAMFKLIAARDRRAILGVLPEMIQYVQNGTRSTQSDRRQAVEIFLTSLWVEIFSETFDAHRLRHLLVDSGIDYDLVTTITRRSEPLV